MAGLMTPPDLPCMKTTLVTAFVSIALVLLNSCANPSTYSSVPASQPHAVLTTKQIVKSPFPLVVSTTLVEEIDGKQPNHWRWGNTFRLSPGRHKLGLRNSSSSLGGLAVIDLNAHPGKTYVAKSDQGEGMKMKFWIEEKDTGKVAASKEAELQIVPRQYTPTYIFLPAG